MSEDLEQKSITPEMKHGGEPAPITSPEDLNRLKLSGEAAPAISEEQFEKLRKDAEAGKNYKRMPDRVRRKKTTELEKRLEEETRQYANDALEDAFNTLKARLYEQHGVKLKRKNSETTVPEIFLDPDSNPFQQATEIATAAYHDGVITGDELKKIQLGFENRKRSIDDSYKRTLYVTQSEFNEQTGEDISILTDKSFYPTNIQDMRFKLLGGFSGMHSIRSYLSEDFSKEYLDADSKFWQDEGVEFQEFLTGQHQNDSLVKQKRQSPKPKSFLKNW